MNATTTHILTALTVALLLAPPAALNAAQAAQLQAGVAKVEITDRAAKPVNDPSYVKALVVKDSTTTVVIVTVDAVAIGEIGGIGNGYLAGVRSQLHKELGIPTANILVNASHCHSVVRRDVDELTVQAVKAAWQNLVPVTVGVGTGREERIMENRRLRMKDRSEVDVRRAYSMPGDVDVAGIGPIDPQIGVLRLDGVEGKPLAVVYNFACHPIQGVPNGGNTADFPGFASKVIEESLGQGALALFVQGCAGDINPARYKDVHSPHDAEPLGNLLGLSVVRVLKATPARAAGPLRIAKETIALPRATDFEPRIATIQAEQTRLVQSLKGTSLDLKTFLPLFVQYEMSGEFPSYYSHRYLHEKALGREDLSKLDAENRANLAAYLQNIHTMERLTRLQVNLALLKKHQAQNAVADKNTIDVEITGVRIGEFVLITFPGELSVQIGLNIKKHAPSPFTFVAGYTNGYIYYLPTQEQRRNIGYAQEDCDCLVAPEWQELFEKRAAAILKRLCTP